MSTNRGDMAAMPQFSVNVWKDPSVRGGMTIRERMAMAAMQGLWASNLTDMTPEKVATVAVKQADLLIAELERTK